MSRGAPRLSAWWQAARPPAFGMILLPLFWGQAMALMYTQQFEWSWFWTIALFGAANQVHILYLNDYADEAVDQINQNYWLSGGSRVIPEGQLSGQQLFHASFIALAIMLLLGIVATFFDRGWLLPLAVAAGLLGWSYSLKPFQSSYRGWGEIHQAVCCGLLLPISGYYIQAGSLSAFPWLATVPLMMIFFAGNIITALHDTDADRQGGKRTFPVRYGEPAARKTALALLSVAYLCGWVVAATIGKNALLASVIFLPGMGLAAHCMYTGLLASADSSDHQLCKRFVLLTTASQAWVLSGWVGSIFWLAQ